MGKIDLASVPGKTGSGYPAPWGAQFAGRTNWRLGDAGGLTQFGVTRTEVAPQSASSLRHWHVNQDEFILVLEGELVLEMDSGETLMGPGDCAAFPAGVEDGHCMVNRTDSPATFLCIGTRTPEETAYYPGIDMKVEAGPDGFAYQHLDGTPYPTNS
ncbi:cupin domain-containing protein [Pseudooceanicola sp. C21-150M6]|uniref:cupin domain-containing protein n=1 Tax=Pseudooceanicola sp. C21-150M6 TaxID=3434355 RepID=UPI003D7F638F